MRCFWWFSLLLSNVGYLWRRERIIQSNSEHGEMPPVVPPENRDEVERMQNMNDLQVGTLLVSTPASTLQKSALCATKLMRQHSLLLYCWESMLFTRWPYAKDERLYSSTNSMIFVGMCGLAASAIVFLCKRMSRVMPLVTQQRFNVAIFSANAWEYSIVVRKLSVILFYTEPPFVMVCLMTWACLEAFCATIFGRRHKTLSVQCKECISCVFTLIVLIVMTVHHMALFCLPYLIQLAFLSKISDMAYIFKHLYFLSFFVFLYALD